MGIYLNSSSILTFQLVARNFYEQILMTMCFVRKIIKGVYINEWIIISGYTLFQESLL